MLTWVVHSTAHGPFMQGHYQFLSFSSSILSVPFRTYPSCAGRAAFHSQNPFLLHSHPLGMLGLCPSGPATWKCKPGGYFHLLSAGAGQPPQDRRWVMGTGLGELFLCILAAWRGWVAGSAKASPKKTVSTWLHNRKETGPATFLHEAHVTLMPRPGAACWPGWQWPLCVASWRTGSVRCL